MFFVSYDTVAKMFDDIKYRGRIDFREIDSLSDKLSDMIVEIHEAVRVDQVRRGIILDGQDAIVEFREGK